MNKFKAAFYTLIACAAVTFNDAEAIVLPKTAKLVPAETFVLVDIGDVNQLRGSIEKSSLYKLYKEPAMRPFVESVTSKLQEKIAGPDESVFELRNMLDANGLPEGRVAAALVFGEGGNLEQGPSFLLVSQWGRNIDGIRAKIDKKMTESVEKGAHRSIELYRDVNIVTVRKDSASVKMPDWESDNSGEGNVPAKTVQPTVEKDVYCFIDDCLIVGEDEAVVRFVVAHIQGASGATLADDTDFVSVMAETGPNHNIDLYVNLKQLIKKALAEDKTGKTRMNLSNLGVDNVSGLGCSLGLGKNGEIRGKVFLKTAGTRKGILKMLETGTEPIRPARFISAAAYSVNFLNINIKRAFDEYMSIEYSFDPMDAMEMQKPLVEAGTEGEPAISLRKDIIEYLGSEVLIAQSINKPFETSVSPTETLIAVAITNRSSLEKAITLVHKKLIAPLNPEPTRELLGHTIYSMGPIGIPMLGGAVPMQTPGPGAAPAGARMAFTITDTHLILGQEPAVERAIRTLKGEENQSIGSKDWFNDVKSLAPSAVGLAGFENTAASGELLWWMLKEGAKSRRVDSGAGPAAAVFAGPGLMQMGNFNLLPEFDVVRKYFGYSVFYGFTRPDGFTVEFKYINPRN
ncbi:MAG: hypothetical protein JW749_01465 [Sedimentisphaerales bacterium]|nr:hypothetical protein [Sedimentisphaerales bacterium]